jgi:cold shock CspA family protein
MAEKRGVVTQYNAVNRFGYIRPDGGGDVVGFYFNVVSNGTEGAPKSNDKVEFDAPDPRKNKKGQVVQGNATAVSITERAPAPPPGSERSANRRVDRDAYSDPRPRRGGGGRGDRKRGGPGERQGRGRPDGERRFGDRDRGDRPARDGERRGEGRPRRRDDRVGGALAGRNGPPREARPNGRDRLGRRKPAERGGQPQRDRRAPVAGRSRFPLSREFSERRVDLGICNPGLLLDKFIEWPAGERRVHSGAAPSWGFEERHNSYFLHHTFAQTFARFWGHHVPWYGLKIRRRAEAAQLVAAGYRTASAVVAGDLPLGCQRIGEGFGRNHGFAVDSRYGYPTIPAWAIISLLRGYLKSSAAAEVSTEEDRKAVADALSAGAIAALDAFPQAHDSQPVMKRVLCHPPAKWFAGTVKAEMPIERGKPEAEDSKSGSKRNNRRDDSARPMHCLVFGSGFSWQVDFVTTQPVTTDDQATASVEIAARLVRSAIEWLSAENAKVAARPSEINAEQSAEQVAENSSEPAGQSSEGVESGATPVPATTNRSARRTPSQLGVLL